MSWLHGNNCSSVLVTLLDGPGNAVQLHLLGMTWTQWLPESAPRQTTERSNGQFLIKSADYEHSYVLTDYVSKLSQDIIILSSWTVRTTGNVCVNKKQNKQKNPQEVKDGENVVL